MCVECQFTVFRQPKENVPIVNKMYISQDLTTTRSETALTANIVGALAMKLALVVRHNSEVIEGKEKTDTESTVTLVYRF